VLDAAGVSRGGHSYGGGRRVEAKTSGRGMDAAESRRRGQGGRCGGAQGHSSVVAAGLGVECEVRVCV
jgi:hypothetical protein